MSDIAERLHVSIVTVSKALAGKDGVSEELRQEILQLAEEMGYKNKKAKPVAAAKTYTLGIVTSYRYIEKGQSFYWSLYERILFYLAQTGHIGILEVVNDTAEQNCQVPRLVQEERVDGVIVMGNFSKAYRNMLAETEIPLVVLDAFDARYHRGLRDLRRLLRAACLPWWITCCKWDIGILSLWVLLMPPAVSLTAIMAIAVPCGKLV